METIPEDCTSRVDLAKHTFDNLVMTLIFLTVDVIKKMESLQKCERLISRRLRKFIMRVRLEYSF